MAKNLKKTAALVHQRLVNILTLWARIFTFMFWLCQKFSPLILGTRYQRFGVNDFI